MREQCANAALHGVRTASQLLSLAADRWGPSPAPRSARPIQAGTGMAQAAVGASSSISGSASAAAATSAAARSRGRIVATRDGRAQAKRKRERERARFRPCAQCARHKEAPVFSALRLAGRRARVTRFDRQRKSSAVFFVFEPRSAVSSEARDRGPDKRAQDREPVHIRRRSSRQACGGGTRALALLREAPLTNTSTLQASLLLSALSFARAVHTQRSDPAPRCDLAAARDLAD